MRRTLRGLLATLTLGCALAAPVTANAGTYQVNFGTAPGDYWVNTGGGFQAIDSHAGIVFPDNRIVHQNGNTYSNNFGTWRMTLPANLVTTGMYYTGNTTDNFNSTTQFLINGAVHQQCSGTCQLGYEWSGQLTHPSTAQVTYRTVTGSYGSGGHYHNIGAFLFEVRDDSAPYFASVNVPAAAPGNWWGPGNKGVSYHTADAGSEVWTTRMDSSNGAQPNIINWGAGTIDHVFHRGRPDVAPGGTIAEPAASGTVNYAIYSTDYSGNGATPYTFSRNWDLNPPIASANFESSTTPIQDYRPTLTFQASDAHSGVASIVTRIDGAVVPHTVNGATISVRPPEPLAVGNHTISETVTDNVGQVSAVTRTFVIDDTTPPALQTLASPDVGTQHGNSPMLDLTVTDTMSGVDPTTWDVTVNGRQLPVATGSGRLQANIGDLVNGTHTIVVKVKDNRGNTFTRNLEYVATEAPVSPPVDPATGKPRLNGLFLLDTPNPVDKGTEYHVRGIATKDGRPVKVGRYEISKVMGDGTVLAGKPTDPNGYVDMVAKFDEAGPMQLALAGSGLAAEQFTYDFRGPDSDATFCTRNPAHALCQYGTDPNYCKRVPTDPKCVTTGGGGGTGGNGSNGTDGGTGGNGSNGTDGGNGTNGGSGTDGGSGTNGGNGGNGSDGGWIPGGPGGPGTGADGWPHGHANDRIAPRFTFVVQKKKRGTVLRTKKLYFTIKSNELATYTFHIRGKHAKGYKPGKMIVGQAQTRLVKIQLKPKLQRQLVRQMAKAKAKGSKKVKALRVPVRVTAVDTRGNTKSKIVYVNLRG